MAFAVPSPENGLIRLVTKELIGFLFFSSRNGISLSNEFQRSESRNFV
jgi:hypothetical protein